MKKNLMAALILILVAGAVYLFIRFTLPGRGISPPGEEAMSEPALSAPQTREMDLFFADMTGRRLSLERREVTGDSKDDLLKRVVEELIKGPSDEDRIRTLPESMLVRAVYAREQTVWVDLGGAIQDEHPGGAWTEVLAVYSVVNTLTENFPDVSQVQLLINGRESETLAGHVDISTPLESRIQLLAGTGSNSSAGRITEKEKRRRGEKEKGKCARSPFLQVPSSPLPGRCLLIKLGIFDSGIGGLTVYREVRQALPGANIHYFGDTARVPYGTKSAETVTRYSVQIGSYLHARGVEAVVVACNTASAYAIDVLRSVLPIPVFGVVAPGAVAAVRSTTGGVIGVIGTRGTISSGAYQRAITELDPAIKVVAAPCPLFVPLVEDGWLLDPITQEVAIRYLEPLMEEGVDTLVLGCTHYPMLKEVISMVMGHEVILIDSGEETAVKLKKYLEDNGFVDETGSGTDLFEVTDLPQRFLDVGQTFLDRELTNVQHVTIVEGEE